MNSRMSRKRTTRQLRTKTHTVLSIRRETGEELLTIFSPSEEWSVYLQPDGAMTNALLGTPSDPVVWINAMDRQVERDEDGTYFIRID